MRISDSTAFRDFLVREMQRPDSPDKGVGAAVTLARRFPDSRVAVETYLQSSDLAPAYRQQLTEAMSGARD